ncbi:MAG: arylsulfatase [Planctomycetaceae bacterium]|nr:arylsulfatase [Planctomycetaceae bacterium]
MKLNRRKSWLYAMVIVICTWSLCGISTAADQPNIVFIMADDVGWSNPSCYHNGVMSSRTPNIDRIASQGMRFTDYYAQPSCTAGRSAFLTGQFPVRTGMHTVGLPGDVKQLNDADPTVATLLKRMGYATGQFGKNHLGDSDAALPTSHGFDEYWGWLYHLNAMEYTSNPDFPTGPEGDAFRPRNIVDCVVTPDGKQLVKDDGPCPPERMKTLDDEVTKRTLDFIDRKAKSDQPFFCWMCPARAHIYTYLSDQYKELLGKDGMGMQEVVMKELDDNIGKVLDKLDSLGIADNTIVVFTSYNGPEIMTWPDGGRTPFHGEKGTTWEGGFRVPMVIRWPGKIPAGKVSNGIMDHMDFLPTLIAAAGGPSDLKQQLLTGYQGYRVHLDGYNQLDMLLGAADSKRKEVIYYEGPTLQAIRYGDWKAHFIVQNEGWFGAKEKLGAPLLFNLRRDPYERAAEESGNYIEFLGKNMWAFGPAKRIIQGHLATFKAFPPRSESSQGNAEEIEERAGEVEVGQ